MVASTDRHDDLNDPESRVSEKYARVDEKESRSRVAARLPRASSTIGSAQRQVFSAGTHGRPTS